MKNYRIIGVMSGTSLDGVDIAYCEFSEDGKGWHFRIRNAETTTYSREWRNRLASLENGTAFDLSNTGVAYGHLLGQMCKAFIGKYRVTPDFIASHGHTIFHRPEQRLTCQIGDGAAIAAESGFPVVCDFRSLDVALGGQGAPLVPIGDRLLFPDYDFCLNLGGFANISYEEKGRRIAFDICPVNIVLNKLAGKHGIAYDEDGKLARSGKINSTLAGQLDALDYYKQPPPKSLGKEWVLGKIYPLLEASDIQVADQLATFTEHISRQLGRVLESGGPGKVLLTGGGTFNRFLVEKLRKESPHNFVVPDDITVNFKEALIFAFLGLLRWNHQVNCLSSVTGATRDSSGGAVFFAGF